MARISFTAPERGALLARAVLASDERATDGVEVGLFDLAKALDAGEGRRFDELLTEHFRDVALAGLGDDTQAEVAPEGAPEEEAGAA
jgi:hypothetical protein